MNTLPKTVPDMGFPGAKGEIEDTGRIEIERGKREPLPKDLPKSVGGDPSRGLADLLQKVLLGPGIGGQKRSFLLGAFPGNGPIAGREAERSQSRIRATGNGLIKGKNFQLKRITIPRGRLCPKAVPMPKRSAVRPRTGPEKHLRGSDLPLRERLDAIRVDEEELFKRPEAAFCLLCR
ncbi:MAG: hypothetical protein KDD43_11500, partial [Bdellovibrionales bacterium]|nr:hypothetical protein [Bdellovibrionales bacterium]